MLAQASSLWAQKNDHPEKAQSPRKRILKFADLLVSVWKHTVNQVLRSPGAHGCKLQEQRQQEPCAGSVLYREWVVQGVCCTVCCTGVVLYGECVVQGVCWFLALKSFRKVGQLSPSAEWASAWTLLSHNLYFRALSGRNLGQLSKRFDLTLEI